MNKRIRKKFDQRLGYKKYTEYYLKRAYELAKICAITELSKKDFPPESIKNIRVKEFKNRRLHAVVTVLKPINVKNIEIDLICQPLTMCN